ncbi:integrase/recombinase xerD homolog [Diadema antillarum]|uniref:integrase/recombinase xerD homolog n=1 Tax=Diadema antillarum TaxID=105358 RepID=UPI003A883731
MADETWSTKKESITDPHLRNLASDVLPSLLMSAKASSTTSKYKFCWARWVQWAISKPEVPTFPVQAYHLCLYLCHLSSVNGAKTSADSLVASVKWAHNLAGLPSPTDDPMVKTAVQGYYRIHLSPICHKEPVTPEIPSNLLASHGHLNASLADLRILLVCFVSYAGFLRFNDLSRLRRKDCTTHHDRLVLHLSSSKTDQFCQGRDVTIARTFKPTCPVVIAERYFAALGDSPHSPLPVIRRLTLSKGGLIATSHGLSYTRTRAALKPFVPDVSKFALHSLRSGGASSASNNRVPSFLISQHGRWKSDKARDSYIKSDALSNLLPSQSLGV